MEPWDVVKAMLDACETDGAKRTVLLAARAAVVLMPGDASALARQQGIELPPIPHVYRNNTQ